jgi:uncharacterized protein (TIGR02246 family)
MTGLMILIVAALFAISAGGQELEKKKTKSGGGDEGAIRSAIDSYVKAFNAADADAVADHWSDSAVYIRPGSGEKVVGRKAIAKVFSEVFSGDERLQLKVQVDSIRLITPDVAIEDGIAWVISGNGPERSTYTAVHVKSKNGWKLDSVRETESPDEPAASDGREQLKQIEWILGDWIDASDDATVEYSAHFAKNDSFIVRLFKVSTNGAEDLEGTQIIGWDAAAGAIRSWVFDSEGGYSEGYWSRHEDTWTVKSSGYNADGSRTSSVATFRKLGANAMGWKLTDREVGGEKLSDFAEIKIIRR